MLPLFDLFSRAGDGRALEMMARQHRLSQEQAQLAVEALLPAFGEGLRRSAADPNGIGILMAEMASGRHRRFFEDASRAFAPEGKEAGDDLLSRLFGSPEISRAVARQAAATSGVAEETLKAMLPAMAAMLIGGLDKQASGDLPGSGGGTGGMSQNPFLQAMQEMMKAGLVPPPPPRREPKAADSPFDNPFTRMIEEMVRAAQPEPEPPKNPSGRPRNAYDDLFERMFETGRQGRDDYEKAMKDIFDRYQGGEKK